MPERRSDEAAYCGPPEAYPIDLNHPEMVLPATTKPLVRRTNGLDENAEPFTDEIDRFSLQEFRAGGPDLCTLPAQSHCLSPEHPAGGFLENGIGETVTAILKAADVPFKQFSMFLRGYKWVTAAECRPTLLITARKDKENIIGWYAAARYIWFLFIEVGLEDVVVEIVDERTELPKRSFPVSADDLIYQQWPSLQPRILEVLYGHNCQAMDVVRRGYSSKASNNIVTILITIPFDDSSEWALVRDQIYNILCDAEISNHAVEIYRGAICRLGGLGNGVLSADDYTDKAQLGRSLGVQGDASSSSTFGGFLELQNPHDGEWFKVGITCYHSIFTGDRVKAIPQIDQYLKGWWDKGGIRPNEPNAMRHLLMTQPSLQDHELTIKVLKEQTRKLSTDERYVQADRYLDAGQLIPRELQENYIRVGMMLGHQTQQLRSAEEFFDQGREHLGYVWAASGSRIAHADIRGGPGFMDWALIMVDDERESDNIIPPKSSALMQSLDVAPISSLYLDDPDLFELSAEASTVYKFGRATGFTSAKYNGLMSIVFDDHCKGVPSHFCEAMVADTPSAAHGDSGSLVSDEVGCVVGLLWGGNLHEGIYYFIRIDELFADIRHVTGVSGVRLPKPQPESELE